MVIFDGLLGKTYCFYFIAYFSAPLQVISCQLKCNFMLILCQFNLTKLSVSLFNNNCPLNDEHSQWT